MTRLTIFTCSVYPDLARIWYHVLKRTYGGRPPETLIFDSSGVLRQRWFPGAKLRRVPNWDHGRKIDAAIEELTRTEFVLIIDDDAFVLSATVVESGMVALGRDDRMAAYTFHDRPWWTLRAAGGTHVPMGSYAVLVKREVIRRERLSFRTVRTSDPEVRKGTGYWDTGDYCQKQLLERGYTVGYAPTAQRVAIPTFYGTSGGFLTFARKRLLISRYVRRRSSAKSAEVALADGYSFQRACSVSAVASASRALVTGRPLFDDWFSEAQLRTMAGTVADRGRSQEYGETVKRVFGIRDRIVSG